MSKKQVEAQLQLLQSEREKAKLPLILHPGHEVRLTREIVALHREKQLYTLADSQYFLLELPSHTVPYYTTPLIRTLIAEGIIPIIYH